MGIEVIAEAVVNVQHCTFTVGDDWVEMGDATVVEVISNPEYWSKYSERDTKLFSDFFLSYEDYKCRIKVYEDGSHTEEKVSE